MPLPYGLVSGMPLGVVGMVGLTLLQVGVCYLIAKCFLGGKGTFIEVMRPLLLVWFVNCLVLIPSQRNLFYAGIVWMMVLMMVFEEVVGIRRLQAFCISAAVNFCVFAVQFEMLPVIHHL